MKQAGSSLGPGSRVQADNGRQLELGKLVKSGGAGSVYLVPAEPQQVAKIYHAEVDLALYECKIQAMLQLRPDLPELKNGATPISQIAWPLALLRDKGRHFRGFTMPRLALDETIELEYVLQERQARAAGLPVGLGARVTLAANLSALVAELHRQQHYVVDLKPVNIRFYRQSLHLAMLDCDGFSILGEKERFPAPQYTQDYLAPEFHRQGLKVGAEEAQDRFALAVIIFQLLNFGIHPFSGRPLGNNVPTDIPGRIAGRYYAYGVQAHKGMQPNPASGHEQLPQELRHLFDRAFGSNGQSRPAASEWARVLAPYALKSSGRLLACARNREHQYFADRKCAACARAALMEKAAKAPRAAPTLGKAPPQGRRKKTQPRATMPPQAPAASSPNNKIYWWVMLPILILMAPLFLWQALNNRLSSHAPLARVFVRTIALAVFSISLFVLLAYLIFFRPLLDHGEPPEIPVPPAQATQAPAARSAPAPFSRANKKPLGEVHVAYDELLNAQRLAMIDALLETAQQGNGVELDRQLSGLADLVESRNRGTSAQIVAAVDEFVAYRKAIQQRPEAGYAYRGIFDGTDYMMTQAIEYWMMTRTTLDRTEMQKDIDQYLEHAVMAAPHNSWVLSEVGFIRLMAFGDLANKVPMEQARSAWETARKTYYLAIAAEPADYTHWFGLAMVCAAMEGNARCAESAFAIGNYLMRKYQAAKAGRQDDDGWDRKEFSYSRFEFVEPLLSKERKAGLNKQKKRGSALAKMLKKTAETRQSQAMGE